ncbi:MAG: right-handed parallel beta-helix repeat-containing protein [Anaeromyxobacteraceae bacterium]
MRRAILLLPALSALAACSVELEGAACAVPGEGDQCPAGQKCGNDLRCSVRAADPDCGFCSLGSVSCSAVGNALETCVKVDEVCHQTRSDDCAADNKVCETGACRGKPCSTPGSTASCPTNQACGYDNRCSVEAAGSTCAFCDLGAKQCNGAKTKVQVCQANGTVCRAWADDTDCSANSLICAPKGPSVACECSAPAGTVAVDQQNSGSGGVTPTGAPQPAGCRLQTLEAAFAKSGVTTLQIYPGTYVLSSPHSIPKGMVVSGQGTPAQVIVQATSAGTDILQLASGSTMEHLRLEANADYTGAALKVDCAGDTAPVTLNDVKVLGASKVVRGISMEGGCGLAATGLEVSGAKADGVYLNLAATSLPSATLDATSTIHDNGGNGVHVLAGKLVATGTNVSANTIHGIFAEFTSASTPFDIALDGVDLHENQGTGLFLKDVADATGTKVSVKNSKLRKNAGSRDESLYSTGRRAGGALFWGNAPTSFVFTGNTVCSNGGATVDDAAVYSSSNPSWRMGTVDSAGCAATANTFYDGAGGRLLYSTNAVDVTPAINNIWPADPPASASYFNAIVTPTCAAAFTVPSACQ